MVRAWQDLEERVGSSTSADKQQVWGIRYVDELVCRDDATPLRLYATQDANFNLTALFDTSANVKQRFIYEPYGMSTVLTAAWGSTTDAYAWGWRHQGFYQDLETTLIYSRMRYLHSRLGRFLHRDVNNYSDGSNLYVIVKSNPVALKNPFGLCSWTERFLGVCDAADTARATEARNAELLRDAAARQADAAKRQAMQRMADAAARNSRNDYGQDALDAFDESVSDRTNGVLDVLTAGHLNAGDIGGTNYTFDPSNRASAGCFAECWAKKFGDAVSMGYLSKLEGGNGIGDLIGWAATVIPAQPFSGTFGDNGLGTGEWLGNPFSTSPLDVPGTTSLATGIAGRAAGRYGKYLLGDKRVPWEVWTMPGRASGKDMEQLSKNLDQAGNYLQALAMAIEMYKCYQGCACPNG